MNIIKLLQCIFLGAVQGFTEPIPISSSGHLLIIRNILGFNLFNDINFEIIVNFGSFIAICILYRKQILKLISDFFNYIKTKNNDYKSNFNYCILIIIGTIPAGIGGLLFKSKIDEISNNVKLDGIALIITALALYLIKDFKGTKGKDEITKTDSLIIGIYQMIALLPGISRSGSTIVGAMSRSLDRKMAVDYSFMLYLPISLASMILGVKDIISSTISSNLMVLYIIGALVSLVVTFFSAKWFINVIKKGKLGYFALYCLIVGILVTLFL